MLKFIIHYTINAMKKFIITERFVGYADIEIEADTEQEAIALYNRGHYPDSNYQRDDMFYDFQLDSISEEKDLDTI